MTKMTYRDAVRSALRQALYRSREEVERWKARDPIRLYAARLRGWGMLPDADLAGLEASVAAEVEAGLRGREETAS